MNVLVTGASGPAGATLLTQLNQRGLTVTGLDLLPRRRGDDLQVLRALPAHDPGFVQQLRAMVEALDIDLVIPTVQEELPVLARARLASVLVAEPDAVDIAHDKWTTHQVLDLAGVAVPRSALGSRLTPAAAEWIGEPFVTKPRISRGGRGVLVHDRCLGGDPVHAKTLLDESMLVSEFVPGEEYCPNVYVGPEPDQDIAIVLHKTGLKQGIIGNATAVERVDAPDIAELALAACRAVGLQGPCDVDVRRRADGTPVVLEINARFGANSARAPEVLDAVLATRSALVEVVSP